MTLQSGVRCSMSSSIRRHRHIVFIVAFRSRNARVVLHQLSDMHAVHKSMNFVTLLPDLK